MGKRKAASEADTPGPTSGTTAGAPVAAAATAAAVEPDDSRVPYILAAVRTPHGGLGGSLSHLSAVQLFGHAGRAAIARAGVPADRFTEAFVGVCVSAGAGQGPAQQAAAAAGLPETCPATAINKVCSSGVGREGTRALNSRAPPRAYVCLLLHRTYRPCFFCGLAHVTRP